MKRVYVYENWEKEEARVRAEVLKRRPVLNAAKSGDVQ